MTDLPDRLSSRWRELRRHPAFQVGVVYAGAAWVIIQAAAIFFPSFWFSPSAVRWLGAVLVAGFVVVVALAWRAARVSVVRGRELYAEFAGAPGAPAEAAARGHGTRRRVYAVAAALLVLGGVIWWARPRILTGSVARGAEVMAVVPFNTSGEGMALLGEGMVDLLSTNLDAVGGIRTVNPRTVLHRWRQRAASGGLDLEGTLAVGRDVEAGSVLLGSVVAAGPAVRLSAELYAVDGGELADAQAEGPADSVLALVDSLSLRLLREIWRSSRPIPDLRVSAITTGSLDAIRAYLKGEQHYRRSQWDSAMVSFKKAVEADSTFALALFRLGLTYGWSTGHGSPDARRYGEAAARHAGRLPARERTLVVAHQLFEEGSLAALDTMKSYVARYPDDAEGWYLLGDIQYHAQAVLALEPESLYRPFDRVIELDASFAPALIHPIELSLRYADRPRFERYLGQLESATRPSEVEIYRLAGLVLWGPPDSAGPALVRLSQERPTLLAPLSTVTYRSPVVTPQAMLSGMEAMSSSLPPKDSRGFGLLVQRAVVLMSLGRLAEARRVTDSLPVEMSGVSTLPVIMGYAKRSYADRALQPLAGMSPSDPGPALARLVLALGERDVAGVRRLAQAALASDTAKLPVPSGILTAALGWADLMQGDTTSGVRKLESGLRETGYGPQAPGFLTAAFRFQWAAALAARPATREEGIRRLRYGFDGDLPWIPLTYLALGQALEDGGDREGGAQAYAQFVRLWEKADPELQPRVDAARRALQRLTAEKPSPTQ